MIYDVNKLLLLKNSTILEALKIIDEGALQIAFVINEYSQLVGSVTDGDIRRAILKGSTLHEPVGKIMNENPVYLFKNEIYSSTSIKEIKLKGIRVLPLLDPNRRVIDFTLIEDMHSNIRQQNAVVIMAGGLGSRLMPLTNDIPKPMLKVGDKPILETIIERFKSQGFYNFYLSVNYKKDVIKNYFKDGDEFDIIINYIEEEFPLGTGGALSKLPQSITDPIIVMNGDILTNMNFNQLIQFHQENQSSATMCVRDYEFQVPYGVIKTLNQRLIGIEEKPIHRNFVNAGIYCISPDMLQIIPCNTFYNMTDLFQDTINLSKETTVFPIREFWLDIGQMQDYEKGNQIYKEIFQQDQQVEKKEGYYVTQ
ncbi:nucleotidyltransferase family protein [Bacillus sp. RG28]|uniref:Nucleotidyltransferase family protein n=1 Tax=Gottfriedia endophytica TaxID=2820819 RepID=A0A940NK11_9BACI|nr:nucleotidyltransferase family protein [Gottfriedia endophytica]MBP0726729.1 nucleotidyltransferase family protein [Gottfriedia endophytica]